MANFSPSKRSFSVADNELADFLSMITPQITSSALDPNSQPQPSTASSAPTPSKIRAPITQEPLVSIAIKVPKAGVDKREFESNTSKERRPRADRTSLFVSTAIKSIFGTADHDEHEEEVANAAAAKGRTFSLGLTLFVELTRLSRLFVLVPAKGLIKIPPMSGSRKVRISFSSWSSRPTLEC